MCCCGYCRYQLLQACWDEDPERRPSFSDLIDIFEKAMQLTQVCRAPCTHVYTHHTLVDAHMHTHTHTHTHTRTHIHTHTYTGTHTHAHTHTHTHTHAHTHRRAHIYCFPLHQWCRNMTCCLTWGGTGAFSPPLKSHTVGRVTRS